ncbi:MAG: hypothetical protein A3H69_01450 [Candidatus Sungbacteria bacterium RIFCSPLOWO2_02_FULL_47_9]|uniref:Pilus assembly protein PilO n=1 Tax=Candidatus Sungbacteria bacterium RIFCSPHIGHO2_01_FULL_47_32 TaxID=1802264 RepID=A0A1G2K5Z1_9BACT|nr:MAG: hypothetical protein UX72_C0008G0004 [Parcubacteria group bacterium GW2011_GWA2_47_10]OGZ93848.1 MAG: hypothetical protein A2633_04420 [Candidatus Sungbacteria bacterium RIFCSPHIGHO2_01_FULL_47_32]OHA04719.1 MAG: hypothetical protein A3A28_00900 [Candidatus Sungbacteria bacterium RIFCSPLOWO2_01_FULL_47_32]OHA09632.1 MAG: hypothetical protein A3H69_01450 [Candidatus Sungbacteria bacterium RIFCSPLOWO2_02_FULL_47_9]
MSRFLLSFLILIVAGSAGYFYVLPKYDETQMLKKETTARQAVLDELNGLLEKKAQLEELFSAISEEDRAKLEALAPAKPDLGTFLVKLDTVASRNGMTFISANFADPNNSDTPPFSVMDVNLNIQGTYESFQSYLKDLEKFIRIMDVVSISFGSPLKEGDSLNFSVKARTYLLQ